MRENGFAPNDPRCYARIPSLTRQSIDVWATTHRPCGHFLTAVFSNDLYGAISHGDLDNLRAIPAIVAYLYNEVPCTCWGSPEKVKEWMKSFSFYAKSQI